MKVKNLPPIAVLLAVLLLTVAIGSASVYGPRVNELYIKYYADETALFTGLQGGEVDQDWWALTKTQRDQAIASANLLVNVYSALGMRELDFYNNATLQGPAGTDWAGGSTTRNPMNDTAFRSAVACLVNKPKIITDICMGLGFRMDTPIPAILGDFINPAVTYPNYPWEYSPSHAAAILDAAGWVDGPDADSWREYPSGWGKTGNIDPLLIYSRSDDTMRKTVGDWLNAEMNAIGIPTDYRPRDFSTCSVKVMDELNYHVYTGGWGLSRDPDFVHDLYNSHPDYRYPGGPNYPYVSCPDFDTASNAILTAKTKAELVASTFASTADLVNHAHGVWLWTTTSGDAYAKGWLGNINYAGGGQVSGYTLLNIRHTDPTRTRIIVGIKSPPEALNVITSSWTWDWETMGWLYDSLIAGNPYDLTLDQPLMAKDWTIGTWDTGGGKLGTKITFNLRNDMYWHAAGFTGGKGAGVTAEDVKFSFDYIKPLSGIAWNYAAVANYNKSTVDGTYVVSIYYNFESALAIHWAGGLPIIPKSVFSGITDPKGYYPAGNEATLIGCSSFYWTGDDMPGVGGHALLGAYRNYYWSPVLGEVDWRCSKGGVFHIDVFDLIKVAIAFGSKGAGAVDPAWNSAADLAAESGLIDIFDLIKVAVAFGQTWGGGG